MSIGGYECAQNPEQPIVVHMMKAACHPGLPARQQHSYGRIELYTTTFETMERNIRDQLARSLGPGGFDPARDIAAITVNRWPHGYAYEYNSLFDSFWLEGGETPCEVARKTFGRIAIANADAGAYAYTDEAINQAYRAVTELTKAKPFQQQWNLGVRARRIVEELRFSVASMNVRQGPFESDINGRPLAAMPDCGPLAPAASSLLLRTHRQVRFPDPDHLHPSASLGDKQRSRRHTASTWRKNSPFHSRVPTPAVPEASALLEFRDRFRIILLSGQRHPQAVMPVAVVSVLPEHLVESCFRILWTLL